MNKYRKVCFLTVIIVLCFHVDSIYASEQTQKLIEAENCSSCGSERLVYESLKDDMDILSLDGYFIGENGTKYGNEEMLPRACTHNNYVKGSYTKHVKNGNGCINYISSAKRCNSCGYIILEELLYKVSYPVCVH